MLALTQTRVTSMTGRRKTNPESDKIAKERVLRLYNEYKKDRLREGVKVTQQWVADKMGVERSLISGELGRHASIGISAAKRWASFFGVYPWEIHPDITEPVEVDEFLMETILCAVMEIIEEDNIKGVEWGTIANLVTALYKYFKERNVRDINEIRSHVRTALLVSKRG